MRPTTARAWYSIFHHIPWPALDVVIYWSDLSLYQLKGISPSRVLQDVGFRVSASSSSAHGLLAKWLLPEAWLQYVQLGVLSGCG